MSFAPSGRATPIANLEFALIRIAGQLGVVIACGAVAAIVLTANPRRSWNQWLAFFLVLIGGNFAAQAVVSALTAQSPGVLAGAPLPRAPMWQSIGMVFFILDPAALAYFTSIFPRRGPLADRPWGLPLLAAPVLAFLALEVSTRALSTVPVSGVAPLAFSVYVGVCYGYSAWRLVRSFLTEPSSIMAGQVRVVSLGVLIAVVPRIALLANDVRPEFALVRIEPWNELAFLGIRAAALVGMYLVVRHWLRRPAASSERSVEAGRVLRVVAYVCVAFGSTWTLTRVLVILYAFGWPPLAVLSADLLDGLTFEARWWIFTAAMVHGIVRYEVLAVRSHSGTAAGIAVAAMLGFVTVGIGASGLGPWGAGLVAALVLGALMAGYGWWLRQRSVTSGAEYLHHRSLEVYRALVAATLSEGPLQGERAVRLDAQRRQLAVTAPEHGAILAMAQAEETGTARPVLFGRYEVLRRLGAGGYATADLALDRRDRRLVVVKRLQHEVLGSREALDAALREVAVARRVAHPNLVAIHDLVRNGDEAAVVLEYVDGGSVRDLLAEEGRVDPARAARILRETLDGLGALHEAGIVHADLKPENILLSSQGGVKLADFGASRASPEGRTLVRERTGGGPGTLRYMAPEQALGERPRPASDIYAVGAIAYEMLTGKPYVAEDGHAPYELARQVVEGPGPRTLERLPPAWQSFVTRATARVPRARFGSAEAMAAALPVPAGPPVLGGTLATPRRANGVEA